jgi:hypothetical protein
VITGQCAFAGGVRLAVESGGETVMAYPQQQGPYGGYQQHGHYGGPPRKNNSAVIPVVIVVVAALAGLGILGFVEPGFFLGDDDKSSSSSSSADSSGGGGDEGSGPAAGGGDEEGASGVDQFAGALVDAADSQDESALSGFKCADATDNVDEAIDQIGQTDGAELAATREIAEDEYLVLVTISYQGQSAPFTATVVKAENDWCWQDFEQGMGSGGGSGDDADTAPTTGRGTR